MSTFLTETCLSRNNIPFTLETPKFSSELVSTEEIASVKIANPNVNINVQLICRVLHQYLWRQNGSYFRYLKTRTKFDVISGISKMPRLLVYFKFLGPFLFFGDM